MRFRLSLLLTILAFGLSSCSVYHPQAVDIPLITHSGDTRIDVSASVSSTILLPDVFTLNATGTYGFNDFIAGQVHVNGGPDNFYLQAAPGLYRKLGEHSVLEGYVGMGYGGARNRDRSGAEWDYEGTYILPFAQMNFGFVDLTAAHIDLGFALKGGAFIPDYTYNKYRVNSDGSTTRTQTLYSTTNVLLEPQAMFRIGGERVKFCLKVGMAWMDDFYNRGDSHFTMDVITLSAGLTFRF